MEDPEYLDKKINPILEKLVVELLISKPEDTVDYMIEWLNKEKVQLKKSIGILKADGERSKSFSSDSEDEVIDLPKLGVPKQRGPRTSVSAEAYGTWNKKGNYVPKVIPKTDEQKKRIQNRMDGAFMFSGLDPKEKEIVINAMEEKRFKAGDTIITQGDNGDYFYVVDSGKLDCFKQFSKDEEAKLVKKYGDGESFGELALLYNAPRAATVKAKSDCCLFALDRECFNNIVKDSAIKKREKYDNFLQKVELLQSMNSYERSNIADALKPEKFKAGEYVVRQGEVGNTFYFIEEGEASATKTLKAGEQPVEVYHYKQGDYFGELALLKNVSRQANIVAKTDLSVVKLDSDSFRRVMGPLEDLLKRNMVRYDKFM